MGGGGGFRQTAGAAAATTALAAATGPIQAKQQPLRAYSIPPTKPVQPPAPSSLPLPAWAFTALPRGAGPPPPPAALPHPTGLLLRMQPGGPAAGSGRAADPLFYRPRVFDVKRVPAPAVRPFQPLQPRAPLGAAPNGRGKLPPSPGWPACSVEHAHAASEDGSSPKGLALHVLAADVREAASGGLRSKVSKSLESLLFISSGASINAALATRNRKTELDIEEPSPTVRALVQAFEKLRSRLAVVGGEARMALMQETWSAVLGRVLKSALGSVHDQAKARIVGRPLFAGENMQEARNALRACAQQADEALAGRAGGDAAAAADPAAAAHAVLEAMQRFAVRTILPVSPKGGLFCFPWLETAVWSLCPALRPARLPLGDTWHAVGGGSQLEAALAHLADVHDALEDTYGGCPEPQRQAVCRGVLEAAGAAVLGSHLRPGAEQALRSLGYLDLLGAFNNTASVRMAASKALAASAALSSSQHRVGAAAELLERAGRVMRLDAAGWAQVMWSLLRALRLD